MATLYCADSAMKSAALPVFIANNDLILISLVLIIAY